MRKQSFPDLSMIYFDALLGSPWDHLGAIFVQSLDHLGTTLGYLLAIFESSWAILDNLGATLEPHWIISVPSYPRP